MAALTHVILGKGKTVQVAPCSTEAGMADGRLSFRMKGPIVREIQQTLARHTLPPEESTYVAGETVRRMACDMRAAVYGTDVYAEMGWVDESSPSDESSYATGDMEWRKSHDRCPVVLGTNLDAEMRWLIEALLPRILINGGSFMPLQERLRSSSVGEILLDLTPIAHRSTPGIVELMDAERLLTADIAEFYGKPYIRLLTETEMAVIAVAVLKASFRDAVLTETLAMGGEPRKSVGIFCGSDEMVNFCFAPFHPDFNLLAFYSDAATKSILALEAAEQSFKRFFMAGGYDSSSTAEQKISEIKAMAKLSLSYWEGNSAASQFLKALDVQQQLMRQ